MEQPPCRYSRLQRVLGEKDRLKAGLLAGRGNYCLPLISCSFVTFVVSFFESDVILDRYL